MDILMKTNKDIIIELYTAFDRCDFDLVRSMIAEDFTTDLVGVPDSLDRDDFIKFGREFRQAFPDGYHQFDRIIAEEDRVVTIGKFRGTHLGKFQGLPATGKSIEIEVVHVDRVMDGKIVSHWGQGNQAGMMKQLGMVFLPGVSLITAVIRHQWQN
jgi:steroid delta-isomerase-like uncharacterized protein